MVLSSPTPAGVGLQVLQQLAGINTVMYFAPTLIQAAGVRDPRTALLVALVPAGVNAAGTVVGGMVIDRWGRRRLLLTSLACVVVALVALGGAFHAAETHSPLVGSGFLENEDSQCAAASCAQCLRQGCGFCATPSQALEAQETSGACLSMDTAHQACSSIEAAGGGGGGTLFTAGCPNPFSIATLLLIVLYLAAFSPGVGPIPWAVNSEIYPLEVRGLATGIAAAANWAVNALVAACFLTAMHSLGGAGTFWAIACLACAGWVWAWNALPETKGLELEEIQALFGPGAPRAGRGGLGGGGGGGAAAEREAALRTMSARPSPFASTI